MPPRMLVQEFTIVTSIKNIANIANKFYIDKILKIGENFSPSHITPLMLLKKLV